MRLTIAWLRKMRDDYRHDMMLSRWVDASQWDLVGEHTCQPCARCREIGIPVPDAYKPAESSSDAP